MDTLVTDMNRVSDFVTIHQMQIPAANSTRPLADLPRPHWQADGLRRILFVETDARAGYLVRQAFELDSRIELKCVNASNWPFGAIEEIGAAAPDMVLLDLGPEPQLVLSCFASCAQIRGECICPSYCSTNSRFPAVAPPRWITRSGRFASRWMSCG